MNRNMLRSGNPTLNSKTFQGLANVGDSSMTLQGTVNKTAVSLLILLITGYYTYSQGNTELMYVGFIGGFILALITIFKKQWSPITVPIYSALEGLALGGISFAFKEMFYPGIVLQAILFTLGIFFALLFAYKSKIIKPTANFKLGVFAATAGIGVAYLISFLMSMFGSGGLEIFNPFNGGLMSIGISLFIVLIASLNLVMDFDFIEEAVDNGSPKYMEWYGAFGLLVTLIWLYIEILRLLAKISRR